MKYGTYYTVNFYAIPLQGSGGHHSSASYDCAVGCKFLRHTGNILREDDGDGRTDGVCMCVVIIPYVNICRAPRNSRALPSWEVLLCSLLNPHVSTD